MKIMLILFLIVITGCSKIEQVCVGGKLYFRERPANGFGMSNGYWQISGDSRTCYNNLPIEK